jgi:tetratricopeptide (TPR) repeat protein
MSQPTVENFLALGHQAMAADKAEAGVDYFCKAVEIDGANAQAYLALGAAMFKLKQFRTCLECIDKVLALDPECAEAYNTQGLALKALGKNQDALSSFDQAIALKAHFPEAHLNLAAAYRAERLLSDALRSIQKAIAQKPDFAQAHSNQGNIYQDLHQLDAAIASFDKAIALEPDLAEAYFNKSIALLLKGDYKAGWPLYEWRWVNDNKTALNRHPQLEVWSGQQSLKGKRILIQSEQGFGDTLQFCRFIRRVSELGAHVIFEVDAVLASLMRSVQGVNKILIKGQPVPPADYKVQLMSLPGLFGLGLQDVGVDGAYISVSTEKSKKWAGEMAQHRQSIGIVWRGSPNHSNDKNRSMPLERFLSKLPKDQRYLSLQLGTNALEKEILQRFGVREVTAEISDFEDTAAICQNLAGVVCVDTSVAHLAGALNAPCKILLDVNPDWRWMLKKNDSHWYNNIKLLRLANSTKEIKNFLRGL